MQNKHNIRNMIGDNPMPIIFEIGSADGLDTLGFLNAFNSIDFKLYCFEPDERNIKEFKNRIFDSRVELFHGVVGDKIGEVPFYTSTKGLNGEDLIYSSSLRKPGKGLYKNWGNIFKPNDESFEPTTVQSITLDSFVEQLNIPYISYVFADVQGCEDLMIIGGKETFKNKVRFLYTEYNNNEIYIGEPTLKQILSLLPDYEVIADFKSDILLKNKRFSYDNIE